MAYFKLVAAAVAVTCFPDEFDDDGVEAGDDGVPQRGDVTVRRFVAGAEAVGT